MGVDELLLGVEDEDEEPEFPVFPEFPEEESEEPEDVLEGDVVVVVVVPDEPDEPDEVDEPDVVVVVPEPESDVLLGEVLDPGCSRATKTPMKAAIPVAPSTAALVSVRTRDWARALDSGEFG